MHLLRYLCVALMLIGYGCIAQEAPSTILNYIQNQLPHCGILKKTEGFVYVDVDDEYIHRLITFIQEEGFEEPPYFGNADLVGAHISVMYGDEVKKYGIKEMQECGETIYFTPLECQIVHPPTWKEIDEVYLVVVEAPELDKIREKYGLPKRMYDFHITVGVKLKIAKSA
jgi:hypothetical protein